LGEINTAIEQNILSKKEFSGKIILKLTEVNDKIKKIADLITGLKGQLTTLQSQSETNSTQIGTNTTEITNLKTQIQQLTDEKQKAISELEMLNQKYTTDVKDVQKKIDEYEENLRQLTQQNLEITNQRNALQTELASKGDLGKTHADEIQNLATQHAEQLKQTDEQLKLQQTENEAKIKQLQEEINAKDAELNAKVTDFGNNATQLQQQIEQMTKDNVAKDAQIVQLQGQISTLQAENQDLVQRIIAATQSISEATNRLQDLNDPAAFNQNDLDAKFQELEKSIESISNAIQGNTSANNVPNVLNLPNVPNLQKISNDTQFTWRDIQYTFGSLIKKLNQKAQQDTRPDNKYKMTLQQLRNASDVTDIISILDHSGITAKTNGELMGGKNAKKTKKIKKQKGGYTYKAASKRRSISKTSSMRSSLGRGRKTLSKRN
jgi:predicted  nucleic acid-binding Zn-ribbon protein